MRTSEVLNTAADLIESRGWTALEGWAAQHGRVTNPAGPLCLEGGIQAAAGVLWIVDAEKCPAYQAVASYLDRPLPQPLSTWNDDEGRTAAEVIEVLRAAALVEQSREDAAAADMIALMSAPVTDAEVLMQMGGTA